MFKNISVVVDKTIVPVSTIVLESGCKVVVMSWVGVTDEIDGFEVDESVEFCTVSVEDVDWTENELVLIWMILAVVVSRVAPWL